MTLVYFVHLANYSDGVLYVLAALMLLTLAVMLDRFWYLRRTVIGGNRVVDRARQLTTLDAHALRALAAGAAELPEAALLQATLTHLGSARGEALGQHLDETIMLLAPALDRRLWVLDTAVTLAPLLGLFGTIVGMFHAFSVLALPGHAATDVTAGVADALVATACGIFIAMIGLSAYNALSNQVRVIIHQLDSLRTVLVNRSHEIRAAPGLDARQEAA
ncbi:MotA/TolQ/ExbB proton channel family protein [Lichenicoccus sp.]|uniref:MotA/TolQ/ExbB proton channel family protein n=1 Tax=Lichenicoccus sp. TaxID=2781899 RepID=UPI003D0E1366